MFKYLIEMTLWQMDVLYLHIIYLGLLFGSRETCKLQSCKKKNRKKTEKKHKLDEHHNLRSQTILLHRKEEILNTDRQTHTKERIQLIRCTEKSKSRIRKYHNHKLQTNPKTKHKEPHNNPTTPVRQTK